MGLPRASTSSLTDRNGGRLPIGIRAAWRTGTSTGADTTSGSRNSTDRLAMRFSGLHRMSVIWLVWFIVPIVLLVGNMVLGWFRTSTPQSMVMQESGVQFKAMAAFAVVWLLVGLVPTLTLQGRSLTKLLLVDIF